MSTPSTILITGARAPVALHWCRLFAAKGWRVIAADSLPVPLARFSSTVAAFEPLPPPRFSTPERLADAVTTLVQRHGISAILPTCEEVFYLARSAQTKIGQGWRDHLLAPDFDTLTALHDKGRFAQWVQDEIPSFSAPFHIVRRPDDLAVIEDEDWVLKPCFSRFAAHAFVRPTAVERAKLADRFSEERPWLAQRYLPGEEVCGSALIGGGAVLACQIYHPRIRLRSGIGAGVVFEAASPSIHAEIMPLLEKLAGRGGVHGAVSIDLRRNANGAFNVLECNPRSTSGFHFFGAGDGLTEALLNSTPTSHRAQPGTLMGEPLPAVLLGGVRGAAMLPRLQSLSAWPGDRLPWFQQARAFAGLMQRARQQRISLEEASTWDIQFDGPAS